jgi:hypothetical protein
MGQQEKRKPTTEKLAEALSLAGAPKWMIDNANHGLYDDYKSSIATPIYTLVFDAESMGLREIAQRARDGEFDAQTWEADEWATSAEGRATFAEFMRKRGEQQ